MSTALQLQGVIIGFHHYENKLNNKVVKSKPATQGIKSFEGIDIHVCRSDIFLEFL